MDYGLIKISAMSDSPSCKKLRLGDCKPELRAPLRVDTDKARGPVYNPQVEAISPTLPSESLRDESPLRSTKEELLLQIARVDREIAKTESQIAKLKKKKVELEEAATQPEGNAVEETNSASSDSVIRSLPQSLYADNRKKAHQAHYTLDKLGPKVELPLYNQPSDTSVYHKNKLKYNEFKVKLLDYFRARLREKDQRETYLTTTYVKLSADWTRKLDKIENSTKKRVKEAKNRDMFEKIFPELRKQREDKERFSRVGSRIKSDADLEEIMDGLHEQELEDKKMRSYAVIPPILLDERARRRRFTNRNGLIEDPMQEYKDKQLLNVWTDQEKEIFKEKYLQHPKNFGIIKSYMERKNVSDCVQYYYLSKKAQNYRQLLRKNRARTRSTRNQQHTTPSNASLQAGIQAGFPVIKPEPNGVTTRQQKEQKSDNQPSGPSSNGAGLPDGIPSAHLENHPGICEENDGIRMLEDDDVAMDVSQSMSSDFSAQGSKKRLDDAKDLRIDDTDSSEEETIFNGEKGILHRCAICKEKLESFLNSRPLFRNQASQYGLNEEDIHSGDRVCTSCRCKSVRRRYKPSQCPIPTCPTRRARTKRLRPFPSKWPELSDEIKDAICAKYQIPLRVTKCCTACFNRISRRLNPNTSFDTPDDPGSDTTSWTEEEIDAIKRALVEIGTDWRQLSERITTKSDLQCRNFYFNFRKHYGLDTLVQDFKKSKGGDGPPMLTDEEESGSTTSSCDEGAHPSSHNPVNNTIDMKDEYDSSATVSAEEGSTLDTDKPIPEATKSTPSHPDSTQLAMQTPNSAEHEGGPHHQIRILHSNRSQLIHHQPSSRHIISPQGSYQSRITSREPHRLIGSSLDSYAAISHHPSTTTSPSSPYTVIQPHVSPIHLIQAGSSHIQSPNQQQVHMASGPVSSSHSSARYPTPDANEAHEQMTVKDLMLATIERQLRRNPTPNTAHSQSANQGGAPPDPSVSPTITSILKSQDRPHLPPQTQQHMIGNSQNQNCAAQSQQQQSPNVQMQHCVFPQNPNYYGSKVEVRSVLPHHLVSRDGLPVLQVSQLQVRDDYETLDLSMKKRSPSPHIPGQRPPSNGPPPAHQPLDYATRQEYYSKYSPLNRARMSHATLNKIPPKLPPPPLLTKPHSTSPLKDGSITHGTPIHISHGIPSKYQGLLRPMKEGSIIQGTPLDKIRPKDSIQSPYIFSSGRSPEYFKVMPSQYYHSSSMQQAFPPGQRPTVSGPRSPSAPQITAYPVEQHNTSRQSIINDYYTSQQMHQSMQQHIPSPASRVDAPKRVGPLPGTPVYLLPQRMDVANRHSPPLISQTHNQGASGGPVLQKGPMRASTPETRQGVIHRATINRPVMKSDVGRFQQHDAFASLVDIAAAQPSLPVPNEEARSRIVGMPKVDMVREGLGKSMVELERNRMNSSHLRPSTHIFRGGPVVQNHSPEESYGPRKLIENRFSREFREDSTLTAATLIDAIITRQINQPPVQDRQSPTPTARTGDRLFASFQRSVQIPGAPTHGQAGSGEPIPSSESGQRAEKSGESPQTGSSGGPNPVLQKGPVQVMPVQVSAPETSKQEDVVPYINWKLRRALQHEREQLESHPDERHIIRVVQMQNDTPKPTSGNAYSLGDQDKELPTSTTLSTAGPATSDIFARNSSGRDGIISPLDYVKNRIVEVMRTENQDDKMEEASGDPVLGSDTGAVMSVSQNIEPSSSNQTMEPCTSTCGQGQTHSSMEIVPSELNYRSRSPIMHREDLTVSDKVEVDSPSSMVIDESADEKDVLHVANEQASSTTSNNPNYEPLTDSD